MTTDTPERTSTKTKAFIIKKPTIEKAVADSAAGKARYEVADASATGLRLRVGPGEIIWRYRFMMDRVSTSLTFGSLDTWSVEEARRLVSDAQVLIRGKIRRPDASWVVGKLVEYGKVEAKVAEPLPAAPKFWTWEQARTDFIAEAERTLRDETAKDYKNRLKVPELARFEGRGVDTITRKEMARVLKDIHARGVESQSEHVRDVVKSMWTYLALDDISESSGVELPVMVGLRAPARTKKSEVRQGDYIPPIEEVGRLMAIARSGALEPRIGYAIEFLVFTCQRVSPVCKARNDGILGIGDHTRGLWSMSAAHRKTADKRGDKANHIIPLPAQAWRVVRAAQALTEELDHERVFPGLRPRRGHNEVGPLSTSAIQHTMSYLPGITATPHDVRRTFSNLAATKFEWSIDEVKAVLDHNEGRGSGDVTVMNYLYNGTHKKWPMMEAWCAWVEEATAAAIADDKRLTDVEWIRAHVQRQRAIKKGRAVAPVSLVKQAA